MIYNSKSKPQLKQEWELSLANFEREPVWIAVHGVDASESWYDDDGVDEATFRPWNGSLPAPSRAGKLLVLATMQLRCGAILFGAVSPSTLGSRFASNAESAAIVKNQDDNELIGYHQPRLFVKGGTYYLWGGLKGVLPEARRAFYSAVDLEPDRVFPLQYTSHPGLTDDLTAGVALGFYRLLSLTSTIVER